METGFDPLEAGTEFLVVFRKIAKNVHWLRHVCLSVSTEHLGCQWTDFHLV